MLKTRINAILDSYFTTETFSFRIKILQLKKASNSDKMNIEMTKPSLIFQYFILSYFTQHDSRNATIPAKTKTFRKLRLLLNTTINSYFIKPFNLRVNDVLTGFVNKI